MFLCTVTCFNPLKDRAVNWLHTVRHPGLTYRFLISDIRALWRSALSARVPECQKLKICRLDLDGVEQLQMQLSDTAGL